VTLHSRFQSLCLQLAVCAGPISAQNYEGDQVTESKPGSKELRLTDREADPAWWKKRWDGCRTGRQREELTSELEEYVTSLKLSKRYDGLERGTAGWRRMIAEEACESSYKATAHRYGISSKTIAKCVAEFG
jgi:hypothetical protein